MNPEVATPAAPVHGLVDHLFRRSAGRMVAVLARILGPARLDLAEEVVQDALLAALRTWPWRGVPENPEGWLFATARNRAHDLVRRERRLAAIAPRLDDLWPRAVAAATPADEPFADELLGMMFVCCHPDIPEPARVALTLKVVCGLSVDEIAAGFLARPAAIAQRLVRARRTIRERRLSADVPTGPALADRLDSVLAALYLLFNEGYAAHGGATLSRDDLCDEAIRLTTLLTGHPAGDRSEVHALLALCWFQKSRLVARAAGGDLVPLDRQDRGLWDRTAIARGFRALDRAARGEQLSRYHLEAGIAACHAAAADGAATDWVRILALYDLLLARWPTPVAALNRAVALARVRGADAALEAVQRLAEDPTLRQYYLVPAALGRLHEEMGQVEAARHHYRRAARLARTDPERRYLERRLARLDPDTLEPA